MKKGVEILVVDRMTGEIKNSTRQTIEFFDSFTPEATKAIFRGFANFLFLEMKKSDNLCVQFNFDNIPDANVHQGKIYFPVSTKKAQYRCVNT